MPADDKTRPGFSLKRWSQRKLEAARPVPASAPANGENAVPAAPPASAATTGPRAPTAPLPPIDTLSFESDFTAFLQPAVDEALKRQAMKKLFSDPRFNVMDGLDTYIDDYSKPDPLPPGMLEQLVQGRYLFDPPRTRVNAQGIVEDIPPEEISASESPAAGAPPMAPDAAPATPGALPEAAPAAVSPPAETVTDDKVLAAPRRGDAIAQ